MRGAVPSCPRMLAWLLVFGLGCGGGSESDPVRRITPSEIEVEAEPAAKVEGQLLSAAGVSLRVPNDWTIVAEPDPNFAMAWGLAGEPAEVPMCTIEVRRQGPGDLPHGAEVSATTSRRGDIDYRRGGLKGKLRQFPGPTHGSTLIVHCRAPKAARQWMGIEAMFESLTAPTAPPEPAPLVDARASGSTIAELCAGTPSRRTHVCARRRDGAVYCGMSSGAELRRVEGLPAATKLSCEHDLTCIRDELGAVSCWRIGEQPVLVESLGAARDLAGGCAVDEQGRLQCRTRDSDGSLSDTYAPLHPLGDPSLALTQVERVLAGSTEGHGCVLLDAGEGKAEGLAMLHCWDRDGALPLALDEGGEPQFVVGPLDGHALGWIGDRMCVAEPEQWLCIEGDQRWRLDGCERRACGCSLIGATRLSCEHEPHERIDSRVFGRLSEVVAVSGACAADLDGRVFCRGPVSAGVEAAATVIEAVAGGLPGVAHELALLESSP